ncbi:MAG TPA: HEAT repeat domain-containing protein [Chloroflexi bacterium]|nr:HEAT repeat domain-containing protein [Chloroflexota bacterium]
MIANHLSGQEPALSRGHTAFVSGAEPMLGGARRARLDRSLFWGLLSPDACLRLETVERVRGQGAGRFYGSAMVAVLEPTARYYQAGRLWRVPFAYEHKLAAMDSLVRLDPERALGGLIVALRNDDLNLKWAAIWFMGRLDDETAEQALIAVLEDPRSTIRHAAIQALAVRWGQSILRQLTSASVTPVVRGVNWLMAHESPRRALPLLLAALRDERRDALNRQLIQMAIVNAIGEMGGSLEPPESAKAVRALCDLLNDPQTGPFVTHHVLEALHRIGTEEARAAAIVYSSAALS